MLTARSFPAAVVLDDGRVLVTGGIAGTVPTDTTELYDPGSGDWSYGPVMQSKRVGHTATLLGDGTVLVCGGETGGGATSSAEVLDIGTMTSLALPDMYFSRSAHSALLLPDGKVLVTGGTDWVSGPWSQAEAYDPSSHSWVPAGSMARARLSFSLVLLGTGEALAVGGDPDGTSELYSDGAWHGLVGMQAKRYAHACAALPDGTVLAAGGLVDGVTLSSSEVYDPEANSWEGAGPMSTARARFTLCALPDGRMLAAGSWSDAGDTATTEAFDGDERGWTPAPEMNDARGGHACAAIGEGAVMVMGGVSDGTPTASAEVLREGGEEPPPPEECMEPEDIVPLVIAIAPELPGHSENGFVGQLMEAQDELDEGDLLECLLIMYGFYHHVRAFWQSGHMSDAGAASLYDAYARVVTCLGAEPLPPFVGT
ncbi:MAG: hypothetical protein MUE55_03080 [Thermoplasmata archaeon]|jgi:hypothetical protein|nr:hypothetical protein [Thermoplasmata archaeon]